MYDNPGDTLLRRRYIYRPWSTLQVPAVLCYAVGSCRPWSTLQVPGFVPISGLLHAVGTGLEYPAGIRFAAKTRRDSFTPSVPALEYPAEVPGVVRNPGGTLLPAWSTLQVPGFVLKPGGAPVTPGARVRKPRALEYPAGARFCAKTRRCSVSLEYPAGTRFCAKTPLLRRHTASTLQVSGLLLKPGGTPLRRRFRPWSTLQRYQVLCEIPAGLLYAVGSGLEYPAGARLCAKPRRYSVTPSVPA